jgi:hypothetical protein
LLAVMAAPMVGENGILKDLLLASGARNGILLGSFPAAVLHFAAVESHPGIVAEWAGGSMSAVLQKLPRLSPAGRDGPRTASYTLRKSGQTFHLPTTM